MIGFFCRSELAKKMWHLWKYVDHSATGNANLKRKYLSVSAQQPIKNMHVSVNAAVTSQTFRERVVVIRQVIDSIPIKSSI